jgi:hypothetical protein
MKRILAPAEYTFDASAQTITIVGFTPVLEYITTIINITDNILIYSVTNVALTGTLSGSVITLLYDTTGMADADDLQIQYDDPAYIQPTSVTTLPLPTGAATQTTLAALLAKIIAAPSTEAKQDAANALLTTISGLDFATQTTLAAVLAKLTSDPSTATLQGSGNTLLTSIDAALAGTLTVSNGLVQGLTDTQLRLTPVPVSGTLGLPSNAAIETGGNLASLVAKDYATQTTLASILAKIIAAPATEAKQDTLIAKDFATQTTLAAVLAKQPASPSTSTIQTAQSTLYGAVTETAPASDTASSGLNGRLQRIAQRITSLIALIPASLGQKTSAASLAVTISSDQSAVAIKQTPQTTGGLTTYHLVSAATTNATNIKASAGQVFGWYIYNSNAAARKVTFHNSASAPSAGASVYYSLVIPPTSGANVFNETGLAFSAGIGITTVTGLADSDSAAVALNDLIINIWYK